jgi:site-specific DNA-methyltransferase (adenine-specific)
MKEIESGSVDAIICDPPYGTVKGMGDGGLAKEKGYSKAEWDVMIDHNIMLEECNRVLRKNGALLLFSQDPYTGKLMTDTHGNLPFSYRYTWKKDHFSNCLSCNKAPVNYTEDVCVFFKKGCYEARHPLKPIFFEVYEVCGREACLDAMRTSGRFSSEQSVTFHTSIKFGYGGGMVFELMVEDLFNHVKKTIDIPHSYEYLRGIDADYKRKYARTFNLPEGRKYKSNVLEYRKDYRGEHPTQKPVALMEDLIKTYTNEGETVLDFTMGSGTTGVACANLNRNFIGIEMDEGYFEIAKKRIGEANRK